jgi:hypothetical protein
VEFQHYFKSVGRLEFKQEPPYSNYRSMFRELFVARGFVFDWIYDWTNPNEPIKLGNMGPMLSSLARFQTVKPRANPLPILRKRTDLGKKMEAPAPPPVLRIDPRVSGREPTKTTARAQGIPSTRSSAFVRFASQKVFRELPNLEE